jgi:hypothetical protein
VLAIVKEISTLSGTPMTFVLVHIWASKDAYAQGDDPSGDNQFVLDLYKKQEVRVKDSQGRHKTVEGNFVHPDRAIGSEVWEMDTIRVDVPAEILGCIEEYMVDRKRASKTKNPYPAFHARPALVRTKDDPRGILAMSDVMNLVGKAVETR